MLLCDCQSFIKESYYYYYYYCCNDIVSDLGLIAINFRKKGHIDKRKRFVNFQGSPTFSPNLGNFGP